MPLHAFVAEQKGLLRHVVGTMRTFGFLANHRPHTIWYQYSFMLGVALAVYRHGVRRRPTKLIADVHTKALRRDGGPLLRWCILPLRRWALRSCSMVLVTNPNNAAHASAVLGVQAVILPDPLPIWEALAEPNRRERTVVFVCSFAADEPTELIVEVAHRLAGTALCMATGNPDRLPPDMRERLERVVSLTGFLTDEEYVKLLATAGATVVLTTEPACLPCGAYEAIALRHRPVLLLDPHAEALFGELAIFSEQKADNLTAAIHIALGRDGIIDGQARREYEAGWLKRWRATVSQ
jgi:glycosyltransferase involved in cell wall biosynthesis